MPPNAFWLAAASVAVAYAALFLLARRPVAIRLRRLAWFGGAVLVLRLAFVGRSDVVKGWDLSLTVATVIGSLVLLACRHVWMVRVPLAHLHERLDSAARGLLMSVDASRSGELRLSDRGQTWRIRWQAMTPRLQLLVLPGVRRGKMALLGNWLSRQYPGPVPVVRIVLKREF